jgi:hypothetical protein
MIRNTVFALCLGAFLSISAAAQSFSTAPYANPTGVFNATNVSSSKSCPVTVNDIQGILQHMASNEVVSYKWVPLCDKSDWSSIQGKYPRTRVLHDVVDMPGEGARYFVNTSSIVRDPKDGIVFVNVRMRNLKDVQQAITGEVMDYNRRPEPPTASANLELAKAK